MKELHEPAGGRTTSAGLSYGLLDNLLEGCQIIAPDWRYLYVNDAAARQGRRAKEQLLGRTMMEAYPGIEDTPVFAVLRQCMADRTARRMENEFAFPDGSQDWFELRIEPVPEGVFILSLEITDRKRAAARITHLNACLRGIRRVNQLITREHDREPLIQKACELLVEERGFHTVVIGLTDAAGGKVLAHAGAGRHLPAIRAMLERGEVPDCASQAMTGRQVVPRSHPQWACRECPATTESDDARECLTASLEQGGRTFGFMVACLAGGMGEDPEEQDLFCEAASDLAFALRGMEIERERDHSAAALADTEAQLRQAQKLEAIGQLAGGIAHDFNNLLTVQMGYCDLLERGLRKEDPLAKNLAQIKGCAERAAALTRQLLAFSRKQVLQPEVLDLNAVVDNIEALLARLIGEDIDLMTSLAGGLGRVKADPGQIEQVIMNLAVNARDAMPQGGRLTLETAGVVLDEEYVRHHVGAAAGPHVMLAVADTGCGMDAATQRRLFEPFFTTKGAGKGTGLGLATVYGIVKQSGGNIWVYSEPGVGTTFKIYLPRVEAEPTPRPARETEVVPGEGQRVLMVEDDPALRELFAQMIETLGYRVTVAANGGEALLAVEEQGLRPHLLITDVVMPGMGGRVLAERLGRIQPGLKVLYTSGYTDDAIVHHGVLDPRTPFLQKPFTMADLAAKIRAVLRSA